MGLWRCVALVPKIDRRAKRLRELTDGELARAAGGDLRVAEAFAVVVDASRRAGEEPLSAGRLAATVGLHFGLRAEGDLMLAAVVDAMAGRVVHVLSATEEQARQDAERARRICRVLGLEVGLVLSDLEKAEREAAYQAGITCGRAEEFGYDYLRDNLSWDLDEQVQRGLDCAFVAGVENNLVRYMITYEVDGQKQTLAEITAYGFFRRYRKLVGVGDPVRYHPVELRYEDVFDAHCRDFYERRQHIVEGDDLVEFEHQAGEEAYERRCAQIAEQFDPEIIPSLQRQILIACCDKLWREQLPDMRRLHQQSLSDRIPVAEFRQQADTRYQAMWEDIGRSAVEHFLKVRIEP